MLNRRQFLHGLPACGALAGQAAIAQAGTRIRRIDIVHHSHTDVGYTDLPSEARDLHRRYIDVAIDTCLADRRFRWTIEALLNLEDWWRANTPERRKALLGLVRGGQIDVMAMPLNQTPFLDARQWRQMMSWIPDGLWRDVNPRVAMQSDVNGFPRAGAMLLLDRGVERLLMGINSDSGGPPFRRPSAFWWKMPDGRRLFVWLGDHYGSAMTYLREPGGELLNTAEASLRASHGQCLERLRKLESQGYEYDTLLLSFTNPGRWDNGAPVPQLAAFIEAWNGLGLQPALRLVNATGGVLEMEKQLGARIPTFEGEWTDWWANGDASGPREVAASRSAKRSLSAALSPVWGPVPAAAKPAVETILKDLCLFDEHTWGAHNSVSAPYGLFASGQYAEKSVLAHRPMSQAGQLLVRRAAAKLDALPAGVYVANTAPDEWSGWAELAPDSMRWSANLERAVQKSGSLKDAQTGAAVELRRANGGRARFWVEKLAAHSVRTFHPEAAEVKDSYTPAPPPAQFDPRGWPVSVQWPGMQKPLFSGKLGDFLCVGIVPPADRRTILEMHAAEDPARRAELRRTSLLQTEATYAAAEFRETAHTWHYRQEFGHARVAKGQRTLELWKREARARLTVRFDRVSSMAPEVLYLEFDLPEGVPLPVFSCGGVPFTPYRDQLPGSCRDYFGIDGWAHYPAADGSRLWVSRDAPLVAVGGPHTVERHQAEPADQHRLLAMVFDNCWHTNFVADSHGAMEFQFDLAWKENLRKPAELAEALAAEPVVRMNAGGGEPPAVIEHLWRP